MLFYLSGAIFINKDRKHITWLARPLLCLVTYIQIPSIQGIKLGANNIYIADTYPVHDLLGGNFFMISYFGLRH